MTIRDRRWGTRSEAAVYPPPGVVSLRRELSCHAPQCLPMRICWRRATCFSLQLVLAKTVARSTAGGRDVSHTGWALAELPGADLPAGWDEIIDPFDPLG